ncbi:MAG: Pr6Pr family membrane protein [Rhizobiaceae bacterium]|nr:Pr6Pr family membrane protein [Rhizobiaceae bacterium]
MSIGRVIFFVVLSAVWLALAIRYPLHVSAQLSDGRGIIGSVGHLFSFFTNVMNTLVALCLLARTSMFENTLRFFNRPVVVGTAIGGILVVMIVYHLLLSATHNPEGILALTNILRHYVVPILFPVWWLLDGRKADMNWVHVPQMTIIPILYLVWIFLRGALIDEYPYGFLNIAEKGIGGVTPVLVAITILFLIFGSLVVFLDKRTVVKQ